MCKVLVHPPSHTHAHIRMHTLSPPACTPHAQYVHTHMLWLSVSAAQHHVSSLPAGVACLVLLTLVLGLLLIVATLVLSQCPGGAQQYPRVVEFFKSTGIYDYIM